MVSDPAGTSVIDPVTTVRASTPFTGFDRFTVRVSVVSLLVSLSVWTRIVPVVCPAGTTNVPPSSV